MLLHSLHCNTSDLACCWFHKRRVPLLLGRCCNSQSAFVHHRLRLHMIWIWNHPWCFFSKNLFKFYSLYLIKAPPAPFAGVDKFVLWCFAFVTFSFFHWAVIVRVLLKRGQIGGWQLLCLWTLTWCEKLLPTVTAN